MNLKLADKILGRLFESGISEVIVCAGARNAPFVNLLGRNSRAEIKTHYFFDERAAGFFALGRARRDEKPVAVFTTSGTAVAELLPAAIEAHYSGTPLVFVTADRPQSFRGSASPQTIEQVGIFSHYTKNTFDFEATHLNSNVIEELKVVPDGVTQINVCFTEPLLDDPDFVPTWPSFKGAAITSNPIEKSVFGLGEFMARTQKPLVIVGSLAPKWRGKVSEFLEVLGAPIYLEAHSGLREDSRLQNLVIKSGEAIFSAADFSEHFDSVLRLGSIPTVRLWRDLENRWHQTPVWSVSDLPFSGLSRLQSSQSFDEFFEDVNGESKAHGATWFERDDQRSQVLESRISTLPLAEPSYFRWLSEKISSKASIFLGNSLPIREWDLAATFENKNFSVTSNRGANGIDGLISTFLGGCKIDTENWLILGDLSALYDLNALAFAQCPEHRNLRIVVINNGGGQIFNRMFRDAHFINAHGLEFSHWAKMFGFDYHGVRQLVWPELRPHPTIIEIFPDTQETEKFWNGLAVKESE